LLPPAKVRTGIEFVDLSPREVAELRDVVEESEQKRQPAPQPVRVASSARADRAAVALERPASRDVAAVPVAAE
jgi:hypothetical protein